jgi:hypothetical protein
MNKNEKKINLLELYKNYLYSLQMYDEYKDKYGDTEELIKTYEDELKKYSIRLEKKIK